MREILFRGKRTDNGEWVKGSLLPFKKPLILTIRSREDSLGNPEVFINRIEVVVETVGQYTGLIDKNGQKIFEGDIISCYSPSGQNDFRNKIIRWSETFLSWMAENEPLYGDKHQIYEVIGNIHDNPELLKGGAEE